MRVKLVWRPNAPSLTHHPSSIGASLGLVTPGTGKRKKRWFFVGIAWLLAVGFVSVWGWRAWSARRELQQANALIDAARYLEAVDVLTHSIRQHPTMKAYHLRAAAYGKLGDDEKEMADLTTLIRLAPADGLAHQLRAEILIKRRNYREALDDLNDALRLSPNWIEGYAVRGETHRELGKLDDAIDDMNMAVALKPTPDNYYGRGVVLTLMGNYSKAVADFTIALTLNPHLAEVYRARASALEGLGDTEAAQADLQHAASAAR